MIDTILYFTHYSLLLLFGIVLSAVFTGIRLTSKNACVLLGLFTLSGTSQLIFYNLYGDMTVWKIYPLIVHLPVVLLLYFCYHKRLSTSLASVSTAYICCQPAKWVGILVGTLTNSYSSEQIARILTLLIFAVICIIFLAPYISKIYNKESRSVIIFGIIPMVYYLFDYSMNIYTYFWTNYNQIALEFLPFLLCNVHILFCVIYYKELERKTDAERKEQFIRISVEQQTKEIEAVRRSEQEIRMLRHDMRLLMNNLALSIAEGNTENAQKLISGFTQNIDATAVQRYCENNTVNYIISDCAAKCQSAQIALSTTVELNELPVDEVLFSSILSNALANAINAQTDLPQEERSIKVMLKTSDNKLLLSVKNPFKSRPFFVDGIPVSYKNGHGYGTQSICYMTQRLGGKYRFTVEDNTFVLQIVL